VVEASRFRAPRCRRIDISSIRGSDEPGKSVPQEDPVRDACDLSEVAEIAPAAC
jgi:hypothetical protein